MVECGKVWRSIPGAGGFKTLLVSQFRFAVTRCAKTILFFELVRARAYSHSDEKKGDEYAEPKIPTFENTESTPHASERLEVTGRRRSCLRLYVI